MMLLMIPAGAVMLAYYVQHTELENRYQQRATAIARDLMRDINNVEGALVSTTGVHQALSVLDASQFTGFSRELLGAYPHIDSLYYLPVVADASRGDFEEHISNTRFQPFMIRQVSPTGGFERAERRPIYAPVLHVEPLTAANVRLVGVDLLTDSDMGQAMRRAIVSGKVTETSLSDTTRFGGKRVSLMLFKAVYFGFFPPKTDRGREAQVQGIYMARLPIDDMLAALLQPGERIALSRIRRDGPRRLIADDGLPATDDAWGAQTISKLMPLRLLGDEYLLRTVHRPDKPWFLMRSAMGILAIGLLLSIAAIALWWIRRRARLAARAAADRVFAEKERAQVTLYSIGEAVITTDASGRVEMLNATAERLTGWSADEVLGRNIRDVASLVRESDKQPLPSPFERVYTRGETLPETEVLLVRKDGETIAVTETATPIRDQHARVSGAVVVMRDMSHERELIRHMTYQATHDALTGLKNRHAFEREVQRAIESSDGASSVHVVCFIDLDRFKQVNDSCGHAAGDQLLRQVGQLLKSGIRKADVLARIGGDEFGILLRHCDLDQARVTAEGLRRKIAEFRLNWHGEYFSVGLSTGLALIEGRGMRSGEVLKAADAACYMAKDQGRNQVCVYRPDDEKLLRRSSDLRHASQLQEAIDEDRIELYRQPIFALQGDLSTPSSYEFLLRLRQRDGRLCGPANFLNVAERFNLMVGLDRYVVKKAFSLIRQYQVRHPDSDIVFNINLSGQSIGRPDLLELIQREAAASHVAPQTVCFEITENSVIENMDTAIGLMRVLRNAGFRFALDDFGTGLSSMAYLKRLPADILKIDGEFVRTILSDEVDQALVRTINDVSHVLGMKTVVERVEDRRTLELLRDMGVDYVQGFYTGRPEPATLDASAPALTIVSERSA